MEQTGQAGQTGQMEMEITIHKSKSRTSPIKLYANVSSRSRTGLIHVVTYIRRPGMGRWTCTCEDQNINNVVKGRHCFHIKRVREVYKKANQQPVFKIGDRVMITRAAKTHERGWANSWVDVMNRAVGKIGTVVGISLGRFDIQVNVPNIGSWGFPSFVLQHASLTKPHDCRCVEYGTNGSKEHTPGVGVSFAFPDKPEEAAISACLNHIANYEMRGYFVRL